MARSRVKLGLIENLTARKACFKKRRTGLVKKVNEFTTLCGVRAFLMIFNPFEQHQVTVWPSQRGVHEELMRFYEIPELDRTKKMLNHESYLRWKISKLTEQSRRLRTKNNIMELDYLMHRIHRAGGIHSLTHSEQETALLLVSEKMKSIRTRIGLLQSAPMLRLDPFTPVFMHPTSQGINFGGLRVGNYDASSSNANNNSSSNGIGLQSESTNNGGQQLGFVGSYTVTAPNMTGLPKDNGGMTFEQVATSFLEANNIPSVWVGLDATSDIMGQLPHHLPKQ